MAIVGNLGPPTIRVMIGELKNVNDGGGWEPRAIGTLSRKASARCSTKMKRMEAPTSDPPFARL